MNIAERLKLCFSILIYGEIEATTQRICENDITIRYRHTEADNLSEDNILNSIAFGIVARLKMKGLIEIDTSFDKATDCFESKSTITILTDGKEPLRTRDFFYNTNIEGTRRSANFKNRWALFAKERTKR